MEEKGKEATTEKKIVDLDKVLLRKRAFCIDRIERLRKKATLSLQEFRNELENMKFDVETTKFEWECKYGKEISLLRPEERDPEEVKAISSLKKKIMLQSKILFELETRSPQAAELRKWVRCRDKYESEIADLAQVLIEDINWERGVAEISHNLPELKSIEEQVLKDFNDEKEN